MDRHENPTDVTLREAEEQLARILKKIELTPLEKRYVNEAAKAIVEASWKFFERLLAEDLAEMRLIVTTFAIAHSLGVLNIDV